MTPRDTRPRAAIPSAQEPPAELAAAPAVRAGRLDAHVEES